MDKNGKLTPELTINSGASVNYLEKKHGRR
jgi:hypothetical protein